ncbi:MAG TPA: methyltransferase domain-containing protein [Chloroflexia bacterium]|nr:methyltransferase domain-containing protein [Chloroflexia bacterium]
MAIAPDKLETGLKYTWLKDTAAKLPNTLNKKKDATNQPAMKTEVTVEEGPLFDNPFTIEDLRVFDGETVKEIVRNNAYGFDLSELALSLKEAPAELNDYIERQLNKRQRLTLKLAGKRPATKAEVEQARRKVLDGLFWELTYWKTPELYEELTEGEHLHPGIFRQLAHDLRGKVVLDAGAGSGRASFECMRQGAKTVYAVEPSPGLLNILEQKLEKQPAGRRLIPLRGRFDSLPLDNKSVDVSISCSAFTADPEQGGDPGLEEMKRVTRPGGKIVIIWPRPEDHQWFQERGFQYVKLPLQNEMKVRFRSLQSAMRVARRFYARNQRLLKYLQERRNPEVPFSVLGFNPPRDYCWLQMS